MLDWTYSFGRLASGMDLVGLLTAVWIERSSLRRLCGRSSLCFASMTIPADYWGTELSNSNLH